MHDAMEVGDDEGWPILEDVDRHLADKKKAKSPFTGSSINTRALKLHMRLVKTMVLWTGVLSTPAGS